MPCLISVLARDGLCCRTEAAPAADRLNHSCGSGTRQGTTAQDTSIAIAHTLPMYAPALSAFIPTLLLRRSPREPLHARRRAPVTVPAPAARARAWGMVSPARLHSSARRSVAHSVGTPTSR